MTPATPNPRPRAKPTKLTEDTRGDSQGRRTTLRRTSTVPEESKPPAKTGEQPVADGTVAMLEQSNSSPDSILSGPLDVGGTSAPDTADSVAPTVPFPPISRSPSSPATSEAEAQNRKSHSRASSGRKDPEDKSKDEQRAFGSPVPVDDDDDARL